LRLIVLNHHHFRTIKSEMVPGSELGKFMNLYNAKTPGKCTSAIIKIHL